MSKFVNVFIVILVMFVARSSFATCSASDGVVDFGGDVTLQRDLPVGSVIAKADYFTPITCDATGQTTAEGSWAIQLDPSNIDNGASTLEGVRRTNIDGIGIRWSNFSKTTGTTSVVTKNSLNLGTWNRGIAQVGGNSFQDTFELVKTDATPKTGTVTPLVLNIQYSTPISSNVVREPLFKYTLTGINIKTVACEVIDDKLQVDMGIGVMTKFTGVGSSLDPQDFYVSLNCDAETSVNIKLENVSDLADAENGVLSLNSNATAKGIGIQVKYNNTPVRFGENIKIPTTIGIDSFVKIPFTASYYQTSGEMVAGSVFSTASFTMTYQ